MNLSCLRAALLNVSASQAPDDGLDAAKIAAMVLMAINHTLIAWPEPWPVWGYLVGRPCVPIFAFILVTRLAAGDPDRSLRMEVRLLFWAVVAQPIYYVLVSGFVVRLNIVFTLAIGAGLILMMQRRRYPWLAVALAATVLADPILDGGALTPIAQLSAYSLYRRSAWAALAIITLAAAAQNLHATPQIAAAAVAVLGAPLLIAISPALRRVTPRLPGAVFYAFYPLHLLVIFLTLGAYR